MSEHTMTEAQKAEWQRHNRESARPVVLRIEIASPGAPPGETLIGMVKPIRGARELVQNEVEFLLDAMLSEWFGHRERRKPATPIRPASADPKQES